MAFQLKFDIASIKNHVGQTLEITEEFSLPDYNGIQFGDQWKIKILINHTYHEYIVTGRAEGAFIATCDRCLEPYSDYLKIEFNEVFIPENENKNGALKEEDSSSRQQEDIHYFNGDEINLTNVLLDLITLSLPMKHLCSKLCKGLCANCGADLNIKTCTCKNTDFDPRLAKLADLLTPTLTEDKGGGSDGQPKE